MDYINEIFEFIIFKVFIMESTKGTTLETVHQKSPAKRTITFRPFKRGNVTMSQSH